MDEEHLLAAARYIELNPVRAKLVRKPQQQALLRRHERTGRPLGSKRFGRKLERLLGRPLHPHKGSRPAKQKN